MTTATAIDAAPVDVRRVLEGTADLLREHSRFEIHTILELEDAVYTCWRYQINVPTAVYLENRFQLDSIPVSVEDMRMSYRFPDQHHISPLAIWYPENPHRYGPGRLRWAGPGDQWVTEYPFDWSPNGDMHSVIVGDIARGVLLWRLNNQGINYNDETRTVPDPRSWQLWRAIERWQGKYNTLIPTEIHLHPCAALDYVRNLPDFTEALSALLAFDSHVPSAVTPEQGEWTIANKIQNLDIRPKVSPDLSVLPLSILPSRQTPDEPETGIEPTPGLLPEALRLSLERIMAEPASMGPMPELIPEELPEKIEAKGDRQPE